MSEPLAYLITWTTYGTWLPGDFRGWVEDGRFEILPPDTWRWQEARGRMAEEPLTLTPDQRRIVDETVRRHCEVRKWQLHALNVRTNHVHLVVSAPVHPDEAMKQFKAWCTRLLKQHGGSAEKLREHWWTEHGSTKWINDEEYLQNAIRYVLEGQ